MKKKTTIRKTAVTAIMAALSIALMYLDFSIPIMPVFIKFDVSELPALITSFALGPVYGIAVCLVKNLVHGLTSQSAFIGELSNFILGAVFVATAGFVYQHNKNRKSAFLGALLGALAMAIISLPSNYFIVYPIYAQTFFGGSMDAIVGMYQTILPRTKNLFQALLIFNVPFTFCKGLCSTVLTFLVYKRISPILKGKEI